MITPYGFGWAIAPLGIGSAIGLSIAIALQDSTSLPVSIVPTVSLVAIVSGAVSMGMLFNRVKQLERRMDRYDDLDGDHGGRRRQKQEDDQ